MGGKLLRELHFSWFIGWGSLGLIIGAALCAAFDSYIFVSSVWLIVVASLICVCVVKRFTWTLALIFCAGCLFGLWRGSGLKIQLLDYQPYYGSTVILQGRVAQDVSLGEKGDQRLNLSDISIEGQSFSGEVWASAGKTDIKRGDIIKLKGKLDEGFGNLSASMYRARVIEVVRPHPGDVARRVRDWFAEGIKKGIPEPQVSLGLGYLMGQETALPHDLEEQIKITGLTHVVVASGYNLTILVVFARKIFARVSKYFAALAGSLMIMSFMMITGLSPSMSRAGLVAGLGLLVWYYGRKMHPFVLLSFAAGFTVALNPSYIWGDLGWYLSFTAFIGVIVLAPLVQRYFWGLSDKTPIFRQLLVDTSCAQILTMPIILLSFGQYSLYALPANILVLPLVPLAMLCTFITGIAGLAAPGLVGIAGLPATWILRYSIEVIKWFANLPNAQGNLVFNPYLMIASYIVIAGTIIYLKRRTNYDFRGETEDDKY